MHPIGQVGDQVLEVARDAADRRIPGGQLLPHPGHPFGKPRRDGLNRFLLRLLPEPLVRQEDAVDRIQQRLLLRRRQLEALANPPVQLGTRLGQRRVRCGGYRFPRGACFAHLHRITLILRLAEASNDMPAARRRRRKPETALFRSFNAPQPPFEAVCCAILHQLGCVGPGHGRLILCIEWNIQR
jgi:hypothetical protein